MDATTAPIITVNAGLTKRDLMSMGGLLFTAVSALITGGYLFLPARQSDMITVQQSIGTLRKEVSEVKSVTDGLKESTERLTAALEGLQDVVSSFQGTIERTRPLAPPAAPRPRVQPQRRVAPPPAPRPATNAQF